MANRLKWVEVEYKNKEYEENKYYSQSIDNCEDMIETANTVFKNSTRDQSGVMFFNSKLKIIDIAVMSNDKFMQNKEEFLAKAIVNSAYAVSIISNNDYLIKEGSNLASLFNYAGIKAIDYIANDGSEYFSFVKEDIDFVKPYNEIKYENNYNLEFKDLKKSSKLKLHTVKYGKAEDTYLHDAVNEIAENLSKSDREKLVVMSLDEDLNYINSNIVSVGGLTESVANPREIFKVPLLSDAKNIILFHNHPSGNNTPSEEDIGITERISDIGNILGIDCLDHGIVAAFSKDIFFIKENENKASNLEYGFEVIEGNKNYSINEKDLVNINVNKSYVLEGNANNGTELKIVMLPEGTSVEDVDVSNYTFEPRTINHYEKNNNVYSIPYRSDERIRLKRGEEVIHITAGALAETCLTKDYAKNVDYETEYIDFESKSWDEYIRCFVSDNIQILKGENISEEYFADEFLNCVEIPDSRTMDFLDYFEPVVFEYLTKSSEIGDNFDTLKFNIIKDGIKEFSEKELISENGFIKVDDKLIKELQKNHCKTKSFDMEMEI